MGGSGGRGEGGEKKRRKKTREKENAVQSSKPSGNVLKEIYALGLIPSVV